MEIAEQTTEVAQTAVVGGLDEMPAVATRAKYAIGWRKIAWDAAMLAVPAAVGVAAAWRGRRIARGVVAGAGAALALGALRLQMARWFSAVPSYELVAEAGALELREMQPYVEAVAIVEANDLETAMDRGYGRLACYLYGANGESEILPMSAPVLTEMTDGKYRVAFLMPPGRTIADLPAPEDPRVELHEQPARHVAALRFRGRFTSENIHAHERELLGYVIDAGLVGKGSVTFAAFDPPTTVPLLRRNELWLAVV